MLRGDENLNVGCFPGAWWNYRDHSGPITMFGVGEGLKYNMGVVDGVVSLSHCGVVRPGEDADAWPDSIHDALAASGMELTTLRELRQELIEDFAGWLFTKLRVNRERFTGRSRLQGGQADVARQGWDWLQGLLSRNRNTCGVDPLSKESEIRIRYDHFVVQVRECNAKFEALDQATDRVVWQLVGLNPDGSVPQVRRQSSTTEPG